ncbi:MAG: fibronectin type III domain-containing protein, partial [Tidjanibacter sp.]|nr:fibronectin type III domain-containing protein [Tidjanibacter sp.]
MMIKRMARIVALFVALVVVGCKEVPEPTPLELGVPANVALSEASQESLTFAWEAVEGAEGYSWRLKWADGYTSGECTEVSATIGGLTPATEYQFAVRASAGESLGDFSEYITASTLDKAAPEPEPDPEPE